MTKEIAVPEHPLATFAAPDASALQHLLVQQVWLLRELCSDTFDSDWSKASGEMIQRIIHMAHGCLVTYDTVTDYLPVKQVGRARAALFACACHAESSLGHFLASSTYGESLFGADPTSKEYHANEKRRAGHYHYATTGVTEAKNAAHRALSALVEAWPHSYAKEE